MSDVAALVKGFRGNIKSSTDLIPIDRRTCNHAQTPYPIQKDRALVTHCTGDCTYWTMSSSLPHPLLNKIFNPVYLLCIFDVRITPKEI